MYTLINQNIEKLLDSIDIGNDIEPYIWLLCELPNRNVLRDQYFQRAYRRYWRLGPAWLSQDYLGAYFSYLEQMKGQSEHITVEGVVRHLFSVPTYRNGGHSLQFSFASKLVHMINPQQPIYDSMVESFFFFPSGRPNETNEQKIDRLLRAYEFLNKEIGRVLEEGLLKESVLKFRDRFEVGSVYTDTKVVDTLIWKFVGLLRRGALRDGVVVYS